jgi:hypothetical protein
MVGLGWIVPPCDEVRYTVIACLSKDRELVKRMGITSRLEAEQFHSWTDTVQQLNTLFGRVLGSAIAAVESMLGKIEACQYPNAITGLRVKAANAHL